MVVSVKTPQAPARPKAGRVSGATASDSPVPERKPFSRDYLDYWALLSELGAER